MKSGFIAVVIGWLVIAGFILYVEAWHCYPWPTFIYTTTGLLFALGFTRPRRKEDRDASSR